MGMLLHDSVHEETTLLIIPLNILVHVGLYFVACTCKAYTSFVPLTSQVDLAQLYVKAGMKNIGTVFLLTDAQVPDEKFLVVINDLLASGEIHELFVEDELENVISGVRNEVKGAGLEDTKENCWDFFIDRVRRQLKVHMYTCMYMYMYNVI